MRRRGQRGAVAAKGRDGDFLKKRKRLRKLLIPFDEDDLAQKAPDALALLQEDPDLLDADIIYDLTTEKPKQKVEEGVTDNYGIGFGDAKGRNVTSEWSRWVTFAGDSSIWPGERLGRREGFTQYLTIDPSNNRIKREYSARVAVCVTILRLVYEDLHAVDRTAAAIKDITREVREMGDMGLEQLKDHIRADVGRLDQLWDMDSSVIRGHVNLPDGGLLGDTRDVMEHELCVFIAMVYGTGRGKIDGEDPAQARKARKRDAKLRQQLQSLQSRFSKSGANTGVAEMLSLLCMRETLGVNKGGTRKKATADKKLMEEAIGAIMDNASSADLDGDGVITMHELTQRFLKARATEVANLLSLIAMRKQLVGCDLRGARLDNMMLQYAVLDNCDFSGASLVRTDLGYTDMIGGDFTDADLTEANLMECDMQNTKLSCSVVPDHGNEQAAIGVSLYRANLAKCNFRGAHLSFANLREVDARQAIFNGAVLHFCQFEPYGGGGGGVTDMRQAFFDDADMTGCAGLEETQFDELVPRKMKTFKFQKLTVGSFLKSILPAGPDVEEGDDEGEDGEEDAEEEDEEEGDEDEEDDEGDEAAADEDEEEEGDEDDEDGGDADEAEEENPSSPTAAAAAASAEKQASDVLKQQQVRAKQAHQNWLEMFRAQEDTLVQEYADRWDRTGTKALRSERVAAYIRAVDDGEAAAVKPLQMKVKALKSAHKHVRHAVRTDRSSKKDPRAAAMADFLLDPTELENQFKMIVATKDEGEEYTRNEIVAFARTADELVRSAMSILRGEWKDGRASALRTRQYKDTNGKLKREQWTAKLIPVPYNSEEYQNVLTDPDLLRVKQQWCELLTGEKGLCLQYRTNQKGASDGEVLKVVTYPVCNYKGSKPATREDVFNTAVAKVKSPRSDDEREFGDSLQIHRNPILTVSDQQTKREKDIQSFTIGVRELQQDGDVDKEDLIYTFSHFDPRTLLLWMDQITAAKNQEAMDMDKWKDKTDLNKDFDDSCSIRKFHFNHKLSEPYHASLTLTLPNEDAPSLVGWRSFLPTACNGVDDENDLDEPDLASASGRVLRRFEKVRADLDHLCKKFKTAVPEDIDDRAESLELFIAEQDLTSETVYDASPFKNMFKMNMKMMQKDLKELAHVEATLLNLTLPISPSNWEDTLDTWLAVEHLCGEAESQKGQRLLRMLFADDKVTEALGMAIQLREIRTTVNGTPGDALPEGLLKRLKQGLGSHIKRHHYTYYKAVGIEQANIDRVLQYQNVGVGVMNSIIMAMFVGLFNFLITYYLDENSISELKSFFKKIFFFL